MSEPIYFTGNGRMAAGFCAGDLVQVFGPPYSAPTLFESSFIGQQYDRSVPQHLPKAAVWQVSLSANGQPCAQLTDFVDAQEDAVVRMIRSEKPVTLRLQPSENRSELFDYCTVEQTEYGLRVLYKTKCGNAVYNDYPLPFPQFFNLLVRGAKATPYGEYGWDITVDGEAVLMLVGGPSFPECDQAADRLQGFNVHTMLQRTVDHWHTVFETVTAMDSVPKAFPRYQQLSEAVEGTVITLLTQQSREGGVLAGYAFHLAYVRDEYGVFMGMLRLGLYKQARQMLLYYLDVFRRSGKILNAQGMGVEGLFHFAENDATEITGYLLLQFFRYAEKTGDWQLLCDHVDFLQWLYDQQLAQLANGTLPFNGDETYIAGGLLPRDAIRDGSAEATMLFILSGSALQAFRQKYGLIDPEAAADMARVLEDTKAGYADHFVKDGRYILNDPDRMTEQQLPLYRYGVCMNLGKPQCEFFGWTKRSRGGVYLCPKCIARKDIPMQVTRLYDLPSALLMPAFLDAHLIPDQLIVDYLHKLCDKIKTTGHFYSNEEKHKNVGYDYGLLLYNLEYFGLEDRQTVFDILLSQMDACGAWSEYYIDGQHAGTRYRPWESAINIDALLYYAQNWGKEK